MDTTTLTATDTKAEALLQLKAVQLLLSGKYPALKLILLSLQPVLIDGLEGNITCDTNLTLFADPNKILSEKVSVLADALFSEVVQFLQKTTNPANTTAIQNPLAEEIYNYIAVKTTKDSENYVRNNGTSPKALLQWAKDFMEANTELSEKLNFSQKEMQNWEQEIASLGLALPSSQEISSILLSFTTTTTPLQSFGLGLSLLASVDESKSEEEWHSAGLFILALAKAQQEDVASLLATHWMQKSRNNKDWRPSATVLKSLSPILRKAGLIMPAKA